MNARKRKSAAYFLFVLAGGLGAHHFYLKRNDRGYATLLIAGIALAFVLFFNNLSVLGGLLGWLMVDLFRLPGEVRRANA